MAAGLFFSFLPVSLFLFNLSHSIAFNALFNCLLCTFLPFVHLLFNHSIAHSLLPLSHLALYSRLSSSHCTKM
ncbi:hypothetical protein BKA57DRAFT_463208 [Linnemannia elongata]|nr:hypothetical protein BKA57DRAFT_463208 [Linnemannia elongata]